MTSLCAAYVLGIERGPSGLGCARMAGEVPCVGKHEGSRICTGRAADPASRRMGWMIRGCRRYTASRVKSMLSRSPSSRRASRKRPMPSVAGISMTIWKLKTGAPVKGALRGVGRRGDDVDRLRPKELSHLVDNSRVVQRGRTQRVAQQRGGRCRGRRADRLGQHCKPMRVGERGARGVEPGSKAGVAADQHKRRKLAAKLGHAAVLDVASLLENPARKLLHNTRAVCTHACDDNVGS